MTPLPRVGGSYAMLRQVCPDSLINFAETAERIEIELVFRVGICLFRDAAGHFTFWISYFAQRKH